MRNDWADLPPYRLDDLGEQAFADVLLNGQRPVAVIGSGLSMIYGGVDWKTSVVMVLNYAITVIERLLPLSAAVLAPNDAQRLARHREVLATFLPKEKDDKALDTAADRYLALDICQEALGFVDQLELAARAAGPEIDPAFRCSILAKVQTRHHGIGRFHAYMATLYKNDSLLVRHLLGVRFSVIDLHGRPMAGAEKIDKRIGSLDDRQLHRLARYVYRIEFLHHLAGNNPDAIALVGELGAWLRALESKGWTNSSSVLPIDRRAVLSLVLADIPPEVRRRKLDAAIRLLFGREGSFKSSSDEQPYPHRPLLDPIHSIERWFDVRRFITLNFDYQLEHALMLDDHCAAGHPPDGLESAIDQKIVQVDSDTGSMERHFPDGLVAASEVYTENAVGRLFEFALNSPDYRTHLLHLHGRADRPETMLLTDSDSNRRYRRDPKPAGLLEHALDVTLTGNPILFIGIGLSEPEITRPLRKLVSRSNAGPDQPAFAVQAVHEGGSSAWRQQQAYLRQYGIHLLTAGVPATSSPSPVPSTDWRCAQRAVEIWDKNVPEAPTDADLVAAEDVLKELDKHVRDLATGKTSSLSADLLDQARSLWFCGPNRLWIDNSAFLWLLDRIAAQHAPIENYKAERWCDYLEKVKAKINTLVVVERLRRLRDVVQKRIEQPLLAQHYNGPNLAPTDRGGTTAIRLRDGRLAAPAPPGAVITRHMSSQHASDLPHEAQLQCKALLSNPGAFQFVAGPLGSGKGTLARQLRDSLAKGQAGLFINLTFGIEIDSVVSHIVRFLAGLLAHSQSTPHPLSVSPIPLTDRITRLRLQLDALGARPRRRLADRPTIVVWGLERLLDRRGVAIAAELELLLTVLVHPRLDKASLRLILIGTSNCEKLLERVAARSNCKLDQHHIDPSWAGQGLLAHLYDKSSEVCKRRPPLTSLGKQLALAFAASGQALVPGGARSDRSSRLIRLVISRWHDLVDCERVDAEIDKAIMGAMAIIGMPIEAEALQFLPAVSLLLQGRRVPMHFKPHLDRLCSFGLVTRIDNEHERDGAPRFVLHRTVLAELRENISARSGEESVSNSFSLTLGVSLPTDLKVPDIHVLDNLEMSLGRLRGVWKEPFADQEFADAFAALRQCVNPPECGKSFEPKALSLLRNVDQLERAVRMAQAPMSVCQRAAAGIIRGFFSSASLVAQFPMAHPFRNIGVMESQKRRIGVLLEQVRESQLAQGQALTLATMLQQDGRMDSSAKCALALIGRKLSEHNSAVTPPLYGNEILWLLNEQANIAVIQGCLPDAERLLKDALEANIVFRTSREGSTSWRRLQINRLFVMIERGRLSEAEVLLDDIRSQSNRRTIQIEAENNLVEPLLCGYAGFIAHLKGRYQEAETAFERAIRKARRSQQQRAEAVTLIRKAALQFGRGLVAEGNATIRDGIAVAENGRQMDIVWRGRLTGCAGLDHQSDKVELNQRIDGALAYADYMAIPRLKVQALRLRGNHLIEIDDLEGAAQATAAAMAIAVRQGMVLQRIGLRVQMGRILKLQRNPSAQLLLERAASLADRIGYQLMVERALAVLGPV